MNRTGTWLAVLVIAATTGSGAAAQVYNAVHDARCDAVTGEGDAGVRGCYWTLAKAADDRRLHLVSAIQAVAEPKERVMLVTAEARWVAYREAFCAAEHDLADGGTAGLSAEPACRLSLTDHHIVELQDGFGWLIDKSSPAGARR